MIAIVFRELVKEDKPLLDHYCRSHYYENSHLNFTNLFMWREPFQIRICEENDVLYMTSAWQDKLVALQPLGAEEKMQEAIGAFFAKELEFYPEAKFEIKADRDNFDYVYLAEKLINLSGRKLHSKKNHLNAFRKLYPQAECLPIDDEIITLCKIELNNWYKLRLSDDPEDPFIGWERKAIMEILNDFRYFDLKGGAIRLDGRIIAFTFGEQLNKDTAVIHVEKADPDIRGAYPAINQGFVAHAWSHMTYINREEDMGHEGLRKAKESYKPEKMIEKFNARML